MSLGRGKVVMPPIDPSDPESLSYEVERRCDAFEIALRSGSNPRIEDSIRDAPPEVVAELLGELIHVEIEFKRRRNEECRAEEYAARFPEHPELIATAFSVSPWLTPGAPFGPIDPDRTPDTTPLTDDPDASARRFASYELLDEIARGGMGVVYRAQDLKLSRVVALKMILGGEFASQEAVERFYSEAKAAAALDHPGIVPIYEVGQNQGQHFYSMAFIDGDSLSKRVRDQPLAVGEAVKIIAAVSDAVDYAHRNGVIHRDLKPANVLIDRSGQPRITDFGLAKHHDDESELTATGQIMGTPGYMSPEQATGGSADIGPAADIYGVGATLYCLLCGRPPFQAATVSATLQQVIQRDPVPPRQLNPSVDREVETICLKCLSKDPRRRYASAAELSDDLNRFLDGKPIHARPMSRLQRQWLVCRRHPVQSILAASVTILLLILAIGGPVMAIRQRQLAIAAEKAGRDASNAASHAEKSRKQEAAARQAADDARKAAERSEGVAKQEAESAKRVSEFLAGLFRESDPVGLSTESFGFADLSAGQQTARQILDRGADRILRQLDDQPLVKAKLMVTIAEVYLMIGAVPEGEQLLLQAIDAVPDDANRESMLVVAAAQHQLGVLRSIQGDFDSAILSLRRAIEIREERLGPDAAETAASKFILAWPLAEDGFAIDEKEALVEAQVMLSDVLDQRLKTLGRVNADTANAQLALGVLLYHQGDYLQAISMLAQARGVFLELGIENNLASAIGLLIESEIAVQSGNQNSAKQAAKKSLGMVERLLGPQHPLAIVLAWHVARIVDGDDADRLIRSYRSIVESSQAIPGRPLRNANLQMDLATLLRRNGYLDDADELLRQSHQIRLANLDENHWRVADSYAELARLERERGDVAKAEELFRKAFRIYLDNGVIDRRWHGETCARDLISLLRKQNKHREAKEIEVEVSKATKSP